MDLPAKESLSQVGLTQTEREFNKPLKLWNPLEAQRAAWGLLSACIGFISLLVDDTSAGGFFAKDFSLSEHKLKANEKNGNLQNRSNLREEPTREAC